MAYFRDLSPCNYFGPSHVLRAIGWLESGFQFPTGPMDPSQLARLEQLSKWRWRAAMFLGWHDCSLCGNARGLSNLFVPAGTRVFVAPELIVHYIREHGYCPPTDFLAAAMTCPEPGSGDYFRNLRAAGLDPVTFTLRDAVKPASLDALGEMGFTSMEQWEQKRAHAERHFHREYFPDEQPES